MAGHLLSLLQLAYAQRVNRIADLICVVWAAWLIGGVVEPLQHLRTVWNRALSIGQ